MTFRDFSNRVATAQLPVRLQGYSQTTPSHPRPQTTPGTSAHYTPSASLDETDWQPWNHPIPATADQLDRLQQWLKPLPSALIQMRQLLETQQLAISHLNMVSGRLTELFQGQLIMSPPHPNHPTSQNPKPRNGSLIAISGGMLLVMVLLTQVGLVPIHTKLNRLIEQFSQPEHSGGGQPNDRR